MENFIKNLRAATPAPFKRNIWDTWKDYRHQEDKASIPGQDEITARSGGNINFTRPTGMSENAKRELNNIINFYRKEFGFTPRADITDNQFDLNDTYTFGLGGMALREPNRMGGYDVGLFSGLRGSNEEIDLMDNKRSAEAGWHPKNSTGIGNTPVHELGHVLSFQLFPYRRTGIENDVEDRRKRIFDKSDPRYSDKDYQEYRLLKMDDLVDDAMSGLIGEKPKFGADNFVEKFSKWGEKRDKEVNKISEYANENSYETVAEALVDYYYNKNNAAPLSKSIVKQLKRRGFMYSTKQSGGATISPDPKDKPNDFYANLRRYNPIQ